MLLRSACVERLVVSSQMLSPDLHFFHRIEWCLRCHVVLCRQIPNSLGQSFDWRSVPTLLALVVPQTVRRIRGHIILGFKLLNSFFAGLNLFVSKFRAPVPHALHMRPVEPDDHIRTGA